VQADQLGVVDVCQGTRTAAGLAFTAGWVQTEETEDNSRKMARIRSG
jgi:hypothetical protein